LARYHHIAPRIEWAENILSYYEKGDFSLIDKGYRLSMDSLLKDVTCPEWEELLPLANKVFPTVQAFDNALREALSEEAFKEYQSDLHEIASLGRQKFEEKLDWLPMYKSDIEEYKKMVEVIEKAETRLKHEGLHIHSVEDFQEKFDKCGLSSKPAELKEQVIGHLSK